MPFAQSKTPWYEKKIASDSIRETSPVKVKPEWQYAKRHYWLNEGEQRRDCEELLVLASERTMAVHVARVFGLPVEMLNPINGLMERGG